MSRLSLKYMQLERALRLRQAALPHHRTQYVMQRTGGYVGSVRPLPYGGILHQLLFTFWKEDVLQIAKQCARPEDTRVRSNCSF